MSMNEKAVENEINKDKANLEQPDLKSKEDSAKKQEESSVHVSEELNLDSNEKKEIDTITEKLMSEDKELIIKKYIKLLLENKKLYSISEQKIKESNEYLDKYRRSLADMENLRKRTVQDKQDSLKYANFNIISDLLIILDDFQRAIDAVKNTKKMDLEHFLDGVEMIDKQFNDLLFKKYGVMKYGEKGDEFDPKIHLAMMLEEGDFPTEVILDVFAKGYMLHDRVIRAAQVKIGKPAE